MTMLHPFRIATKEDSCFLEACGLLMAVYLLWQVYSRNSENSLGKYPDAAEIVKKHLKPGIKGIVIDSEVCEPQTHSLFGSPPGSFCGFLIPMTPHDCSAAASRCRE